MSHPGRLHRLQPLSTLHGQSRVAGIDRVLAIQPGSEAMLIALPDISGRGVERVYVQVFLVVWGGAPGVLWRLDRCQSWMVGKVLKRCFEKRCKIDGASTAIFEPESACLSAMRSVTSACRAIQRAPSASSASWLTAHFLNHSPGASANSRSRSEPSLRRNARCSIPGARAVPLGVCGGKRGGCGPGRHRIEAATASQPVSVYELLKTFSSVVSAPRPSRR